MLTISWARISAVINEHVQSKSLSTQASPLSPNDSAEDDREPNPSDSPQSHHNIISRDDLCCPDCGKNNTDEKARRRHYATRKTSNLR